MGERTNITGQKFGRLLAISKATPIIDKSGRRRYTYKCKCDCGATLVVRKEDLTSKNTMSCGCLHKERTSNNNKKHGHYANYQTTEHYERWLNMIDRCNNPKSKSYKNYGARGIKVCKEWQNSFEQYCKDIGTAPSKKHSLDRIDNNKDYCKENIRWAPANIQSINQRIRKDNKSKIKGVSYRANRKKWIARITINKKVIHLGSYNTIEEATKARKEAEKKYHNIEKLLLQANVANGE